MMPHANQTGEQYLEACAVAAGERSPRATPEQIEALKAMGYTVECTPMDADPEFGIDAHNVYQWFLGDEFQDVEPSYSEADSWALALEHSQE